MPNAPGRLSGPREYWDQLIAEAHAAGKLDDDFHRQTSLNLLLDIREMLIVQNLIANQTNGLLAQALGKPVEKNVGGVIIP